MTDIISTGRISAYEELIASSVAPVTSSHIATELKPLVYFEVNGNGTVSATVVIEYTNDLTTWVAGPTLTKSGTDIASSAVTLDNSVYKLARARLTAISGTNAVCTVTVNRPKEVEFRVPLEYLVTD